MNCDREQLNICHTSVVNLTHGGEADGDWCSLANMLKQFCLAVASDVMSHLKVTKSSLMKEKKMLMKV